MPKKNSFIGKDIATPEGYGEIVEMLSHDQVLIEFPTKKRKVFGKDILKNIVG